MLVVKIDHSRVYVDGQGSLDDVIEDVLQVVGSIYAQMGTADPEAAKEFRRVLVSLFVDIDSPVWQMSPAVGGIASVIPVESEDA